MFQIGSDNLGLVRMTSDDLGWIRMVAKISETGRTTLADLTSQVRHDFRLPLRNDRIAMCGLPPEEGVVRRPAVPNNSKVFASRCLQVVFVIFEASQGELVGRIAEVVERLKR